MLNLIKVMKPYLEQLRKSNDLSLKLVFFDGEEAFRTWGPKDSIYGARELAKQLSSNHFKTNLGRVVTELARWDVMVLLDLLGAPDPKFYSLVQSGQKWYLNFVRAEQQLSDLDLLVRYSSGKSDQTYFNPRSTQSFVEDDHIPFMKRGTYINFDLKNTQLLRKLQKVVFFAIFFSTCCCSFYIHFLCLYRNYRTFLYYLFLDSELE